LGSEDLSSSGFAGKFHFNKYNHRLGKSKRRVSTSIRSSSFLFLQFSCLCLHVLLTDAIVVCRDLFMDSGNSNHGSPSKRQKLTPRTHELGVMRMSTDNGSASFLGSSSGIHFIRVVYNAFARRSALLNRPQQPSKDTQVPGEDDQLQHQHNQYRPDLWLPHELKPQALTTRYDFDSLVQWTRGYFHNWHPMFPFCSGPAFLVILELISRDGFSSLSAADGILVRSIISISLMDRRQDSSPTSQIPVPSALVFRSVHQAMESLHALFCEPPTIPILQAAFSVQLFLTSLLRLNAASRVGGAIIRTAFHLGLHRCPVRFSGFSSEEAATRRRLFWSIYCLERYLSQALGIPLGIRDDDIDVCYPNAEMHGPAAEEGVSYPFPLERLLTFGR
jgi:hypothetical protein